MKLDGPLMPRIGWPFNMAKRRRRTAMRFRRSGDLARDHGDWQAAIAAYRQHLDLHPSDHAIWIQYGHALKEAGQLTDALAAYEASIPLNPADPDRDHHWRHLHERLAMDPFLEAPDGSFRRHDPARPATVTVPGIGKQDQHLLAARLSVA